MKLYTITALLIGGLLIAGDEVLAKKKGKNKNKNPNAPQQIQPKNDPAPEGSGTGSSFTSEVEVFTQDPESPLSDFTDALTDPNSPVFEEAVADAVTLLQQLLAQTFADLGLPPPNILILGFAPGGSAATRSVGDGVIILYEVIIEAEDIATAVEQGNDVSEDSIQVELFEAITDPDLQAEIKDDTTLQLVAPNSIDEVVVNGGDGQELESGCPECWGVVDGFCVPDSDKMILECGANGMNLKVKKCIMGDTRIDLLQLDQSSCGITNGQISSVTHNSVDMYQVDIGLDECSTSMSIDGDKVTFVNHLIGGLDNGIISDVDQHNIEFTCTYQTQISDITSESEVTSAIQGGDSSGQGQLGFEIVKFTDSSFTDVDSSNTAQVASTLYFGVQITNEINNIEFSTLDCSVKNKEHDLEYSIMTARCPNTRIKFEIHQNQDSKINKFSYMVFEFRVAPAARLHLTCSVIVCAQDNPDSTCNSATSCNKRRKRDVPDGMDMYMISKEFIVQ